MLCPTCGSPDSEVKDSRPVGNRIRRRRACKECGERFKTYEDQVSELDAATPTMRAILMQCCAENGVTVEQAMGNGRTKKIVAARRRAAWEMWSDLGKSYSEIGGFMGGRDHTSIMRMIHKHQEGA